MRRSQLSVARPLCAVTFLFVCAAMSCAATSLRADCPQMIPLYPTSHISSAQIEDLTSLVKMRPESRCFPTGDQEVQCTASEPVIWWFTQDGHRAHPAVSRAQWLRNDRTGESCLVRDGYFTGSKRAFAKWLDDLKARDEQTVRQMRPPSPPSAH